MDNQLTYISNDLSAFIFRVKWSNKSWISWTVYPELEGSTLHT